MQAEQQALRRRYEEALDAFTERVRQDRTIIAAIVYGSLAYDDVWRKSDIDILLVTREEKEKERSFSLVEHGINFHAELGPRQGFKKLVERALQSSFTHSILSRSRLLFSHDATITAYFAEMQGVGARDREMQLLRAGTWLLPVLAKAEKWCYIKHDVTYSFLWIMYCVRELATIEVLLHAEITGREVILQALKLNPDFFNRVYTDLIQQPKDEAAIREALGLINDYLADKMLLLFGPILHYLAEEGGVRSSSEIDRYFRERAQSGTMGLSPAYEWLAGQGIIQMVSAPVRLTRKSAVHVDEAAYYYDGGAS